MSPPHAQGLSMHHLAARSDSSTHITFQHTMRRLKPRNHIPRSPLFHSGERRKHTTAWSHRYARDDARHTTSAQAHYHAGVFGARMFFSLLNTDANNKKREKKTPRRHGETYNSEKKQVRLPNRTVTANESRSVTMQTKLGWEAPRKNMAIHS